MSKEIIINAEKERTRIAIVEGGVLSELYVEHPENVRTIGDIYLAKVRNLMPSIQAAFVDIGSKQDAFLHFSDVDETLPDLLRLVGETPKLNDFEVQLKVRRTRKSLQEREDADEEELDLGEDDEGLEIVVPDQNGAKSAPKPAAKKGAGRGGRSNGKSGPKGKGKGKGRAIDHIDIHPARYIRNNQRVLVQITKEPISSKGSRICTNISLAGRFLVLVPGADYVAVSRRIWSLKERRRLRLLAKSLVPKGFGLIVRTVAESRDAKSLDTDLRLLLQKWDKLVGKIKESKKAPRLLHQDVSMVSSIIRDIFSDDYDRVLIDSPALHRNVKNYIQAVAPHMVEAVQLHTSDKPIFDAVNISKAIGAAFNSRVDMKSGGYLFIEHTEAMHVIDVNSGNAGKGKGKTQEENSLKVNIEAAHEIAKQLRLRDLGGIIVVDFIDLREDRNRKKVFDELRRSFRKDRAVTKILPMSDFGLMQITRQRLRPSITTDSTISKEETKAAKEREKSVAKPSPAAPASRSHDDEPRSRGRNRSQSSKTPVSKIIGALERQLEVMASEGRNSVPLTVHPFMAAYLQRGWPSNRLKKIGKKAGVRINLVLDDQLTPTTFRLTDKTE